MRVRDGGRVRAWGGQLKRYVLFEPRECIIDTYPKLRNGRGAEEVADGAGPSGELTLPHLSAASPQPSPRASDP